MNFLSNFVKYNNKKTILLPCVGLADIIENGNNEEIYKYLKSNIEQYLTALNDKVSAKPAVYYLSSGSCTEADAQILKELGFETVLCHEQTAAKTVGELNVVQLLGYNDTDVAGSISSSEGNCGLEIWVSWDKSVRTRVRYTSAALQNLLNNSTITLTGLDDMLNGEPVSVSQTPEERISQIDQRLDELYH